MVAFAMTAVVGLSLNVWGQGVTLTEPPTPLLPQSFGGWQAQGQVASGTDAAQADAKFATELKEDGFERFAGGEYRQAGRQIQVKALQFVDITGAKAAFSLYRGSHAGLRQESNDHGKVAEAAASENEVLWQYRTTVMVVSGPRAKLDDLQVLESTLPKVGGTKGIHPMLPTLLPEHGLEAGSERYSLGPESYAANGGFLPKEILGFEKSAEAMTAHYSGRGRETLTLLLYPTPQIAGDRGKAIETWLNTHAEGLGTIKLRREGPMLVLANGGFSAEEAQRMVENTHLRVGVTWDKKIEPDFHEEVHKTASLLVSIMVLSGLLMVAALVIGLFLGGGRAAIRVLRGKPAAVEPEFLGLGLEPGRVKPIGSRAGKQ